MILIILTTFHFEKIAISKIFAMKLKAENINVHLLSTIRGFIHFDISIFVMGNLVLRSKFDIYIYIDVSPNL